MLALHASILLFHEAPSTSLSEGVSEGAMGERLLRDSLSVSPQARNVSRLDGEFLRVFHRPGFLLNLADVVLQCASSVGEI